MFLINIKSLTCYTFKKYIFSNVFMNLSFMDFLFHVPFFCTATAAAETDILAVCLVNIEFRESQKADCEPSSHFVKILLVVCKNCLNQLDVNKQCLIRACCY
jgi:hypothetical protein